jgi:hypothetical protein
MITGVLDGLVSGTEYVVFDREVTGSAVSSIDTGNILNGDEDGWYTVIFRLVGGNANARSSLQFNGDTGNNYGRRGINASNTTVSDSTVTGTSSFNLIGFGGSGESSISVTRIYAKSGAARLGNSTLAYSISGTTLSSIITSGFCWNNTDNLVSMNFFGAANDFAVGTRVIIIKSNNFTNGTPTGVINTPYIKGSWVRVGSQVLDSATNSVTFSGLDGDRDVLYLIKTFVKAGDANAHALIRINNDSTAGIYGYQALYANNTTVAAGRGTAAQIYTQWNNLANGAYGTSSSLLFAKTGFVRPLVMDFVNSISGTTVTECGVYGQVYNQTSNNITSLVISTPVANGFAIGSQFDLYALRPNG